MSSCKVPNCDLKNFNGCLNSLTFCDISGDINNEISVATCLPKDPAIGILKRDLAECNVPLTSENPQFECEEKIGCEWDYPAIMSGNNLLEKQCIPMKDVLGEIKAYTCGSSPSSGTHESSFTTNNDLARRSLKEKDTFGCPKDKCNYTQVKKTRENGECSPTGSDNIINEATGQKCGDLSTKDICLTYPNCRWGPKDEEHCGLKRLFYQDLQVSDEKCKSIQDPSEETCNYWGCIWDIYGDRGSTINYDKNTSGICVSPTNEECMKNFCSKNTQKVGGGLRNSFHPDGICTYTSQVGENSCSPSYFEIVGSKTPGLMEIPGGNTDVENVEIRDLKTSISNQQEVIKSEPGDIVDKRSKLNNYIDDLYRSSCEVRGEYTTDTKLYSKNKYDYGSYECVGDNVGGNIANADRNINNICSAMKEGNTLYYRKNWPSLDGNEHVEKVATFGAEGVRDFIRIGTGAKMYHGLTFGSQGSNTGRCINKYSSGSEEYIFDCANITERKECLETKGSNIADGTLECEWYEPNERCKINMDQLIDTFTEDSSQSPEADNLWNKIIDYYPGGYCSYGAAGDSASTEKVYRLENNTGGGSEDSGVTIDPSQPGGPHTIDDASIFSSNYTYLNGGRNVGLRVIDATVERNNDTHKYRICYDYDDSAATAIREDYSGGNIYCSDAPPLGENDNIASGVLDINGNIDWTNGPEKGICIETATTPVPADTAACAGVTGGDLDTATACETVKTVADASVAACTYIPVTGKPSSFMGTIGDVADKGITFSADFPFFMKPEYRPSVAAESGVQEPGYFINIDDTTTKTVLLTLDEKASEIHGEYNNMEIELYGNISGVKGDIEYYGGGGLKYVFVNWVNFADTETVPNMSSFSVNAVPPETDTVTSNITYTLTKKNNIDVVITNDGLVDWKILFFKDTAPNKELFGIYKIKENSATGTSLDLTLEEIYPIATAAAITDFKLIPPITVDTKYRIHPKLVSTDTLYPKIPIGTLISMDTANNQTFKEVVGSQATVVYNESRGKEVFLINKEINNKVDCDGESLSWTEAENKKSRIKALQYLRKDHNCSNLFNEVYNTIRDNVNKNKNRITTSPGQADCYDFLKSVLNDIDTENTSNQTNTNSRLNGWRIEFKDIILPVEDSIYTNSSFDEVCINTRKENFDECRLNKDMCIDDGDCIWGGVTGVDDYVSGECSSNDVEVSFNNRLCPMIQCGNMCVPHDNNSCKLCSELTSRNDCVSSGCEYTAPSAEVTEACAATNAGTDDQACTDADISGDATASKSACEGAGACTYTAAVDAVLESCAALSGTDNACPSPPTTEASCRDTVGCEYTAAVAGVAATCTETASSSVTEDAAACAAVTDAALSDATACEAVLTDDASDADTKACTYAAAVPAVSESCIANCSGVSPTEVDYTEPSCMSKVNYSKRMLCKYSGEILEIYKTPRHRETEIINSISIYLAKKSILVPNVIDLNDKVEAPIDEVFGDGGGTEAGVFKECMPSNTMLTECSNTNSKNDCETNNCIWNDIDKDCRRKDYNECRLVDYSNCSNAGCEINNTAWKKGDFKGTEFQCLEGNSADCKNIYWVGEHGVIGGWRKPWGSIGPSGSAPRRPDEYGKRINIDGILNREPVKASGLANIIGNNIYVDWDNEQLQPITVNDNVNYSLEDINTKGIEDTCIYDDTTGKYKAENTINNNLYEGLIENLPSKVNIQNQKTGECEEEHTICNQLTADECNDAPYGEMCEYSTEPQDAQCTGTNDGVPRCTTTPVSACATANADQATCEGAGSCTWDSSDRSCTTTDQDRACNAAVTDRAACEAAGDTPGDCTYSPGADCALNGDSTACAVGGSGCTYIPATAANTCRTKTDQRNICPDDTLLWEGGQWNHILDEGGESTHTITNMVYNTGKATVIIGVYSDRTPYEKLDDVYPNHSVEKAMKGFEESKTIQFSEISASNLTPDDKILKTIHNYDCNIKVHSYNTIEVEIDDVDPGDIDQYIFNEFKYKISQIADNNLNGGILSDIIFLVEYVRFHDITMDIYLDIDIRPLYKKNDIINIKKLLSDGNTVNTSFKELFNPHITIKDEEVYTKIIDTDYQQNKITVNNILRKNSGPYFPRRHDINKKDTTSKCIKREGGVDSLENITSNSEYSGYCGASPNDIRCHGDTMTCDSNENNNEPCRMPLEFSYCESYNGDSYKYYTPFNSKVILTKKIPTANNIYDLHDLFLKVNVLENHKDKTNFNLEGCIIRYITTGTDTTDFSEKYGYIQDYRETHEDSGGNVFTGCKILTPTDSNMTRNETNDGLILLSIDFPVSGYKKINNSSEQTITQDIQIKPYKRKEISLLISDKVKRGNLKTREYFQGINSKDICDFNNGIWEDFNCRTHGYSLNNIDICEKNGLLWKNESNICVKELSSVNDYYKTEDDDKNYCSRKTDSVKNTAKEEVPPNQPCPSCNHSISNGLIECKKNEERDCMKKNEINCNLDSGCEYYKDMMEPPDSTLPSQAVFSCSTKEGVTPDATTCSANTDILSCEEDNCEWQCPFTPNSRNQPGYKVTKSIDSSPLTTTLNNLTSDYYAPSDLSVECDTGWERYSAVDLKANCVENINSDSRTESHTHRIELSGCRKTIHCSDNKLNESILNEDLLSEMEIEHVPNEFTKVVGNNRELDLTKIPTNNGEFPCGAPKELIGEPNDTVGWSEEICCIGQGLCSGNTDSTKDVTCPSGQVLKKVYYGESTELLPAKGSTVGECCVVPGAPTVTIPLDADYAEIAGAEGSVQRDAFEENFRTDILSILNASTHINTTITSEMIEILNVGEGSIIVTFKVNKDTTGNVILEEQITKAISPGTPFTSVGAVSNAAPSYKPYDPKSKYFYWSDSLNAGITLDQLITTIFLVICILSSSFAVLALLLK
tara:strand:- start:382 stop:9072 length:8691 start_codon:yes stop_codon:yes gene_type:complete